MDDFINSVDILGDEAVIDSIIDRTITEFNDNKIDCIGFPSQQNNQSTVFKKCQLLTRVNCPNVTKVGGGSFEGCTSLEEANLPNVEYVTYSPFRDCSSLKLIYFPKLIGITGGHTFYNCSSLEQLRLPNLESVTTGSEYAKCTSLKYAEFGKITRFRLGSFSDDRALVALVLRNDFIVKLEPINTFNNTPIASGTGFIYVPRALLSDDDETMDYRRATNWSTYATQFRALEDYTVDGTVTGELDETKI